MGQAGHDHRADALAALGICFLDAHAIIRYSDRHPVIIATFHDEVDAPRCAPLEGVLACIDHEFGDRETERDGLAHCEHNHALLARLKDDILLGREGIDNLLAKVWQKIGTVDPVMGAEFVEAAMRGGDDIDPAPRGIKRIPGVRVFHGAHMHGHQRRDDLKAVSDAMVDLVEQRFLDFERFLELVLCMIAGGLIAHCEHRSDLRAVTAEDGPCGADRDNDRTVRPSDLPWNVCYGTRLFDRERERQLLRRIRLLV